MIVLYCTIDKTQDLKMQEKLNPFHGRLKVKISSWRFLDFYIMKMNLWTNFDNFDSL